MIKIENNLEKLQIKFKQLQTIGIGKISTYKQLLLEPVQKSVSSNFSKGQSGDGQKWKRLADSTIAQKAKLNFPADPLVRERNLENAVNNLQVQPAGQGQVLLFGLGGDSKVKRIAAYQQFGTKRIPSRPFLTLNIRLSEVLANVIITNEVKRIKETLSI